MFDALAILKSEVDESPQDVGKLLTLAEMLAAVGESVEAEQHIRAALELESGDLWHLYNLANLKFRQFDFEKAESLTDCLLEKVPYAERVLYSSRNAASIKATPKGLYVFRN